MIEKQPIPFSSTDFKITDGLPPNIAWDNLEAYAADELVGYGLFGKKL